MLRYPIDRAAWVEIDLDAIRANTKALKQQIGPRVRLMCAVKADGYGHGAVRCAKVMRKAGADQFAVATVAEGIELREEGIDTDILLLNQTPLSALDLLVKYDIMPAVFDADYALAYGERAAAANKVGKYHLAIDTGMTRIGVMPEDALELRRTLDFHRGLECAGIFTHFATAEVIEDWDFKLQAARFAETVKELEASGLDCGLVHCDNTPGMILHPRLRYDMCRAGIGLYGLHPSDTTRPRINLKPAMSVRARVTRVIEPQVGTGVSYGFNYRVSRQGTQVATVPIGYADGLARTLSGQMDVIVNGTRARQVGNICMDQFMFAVDPAGPRGYRPSRPVREDDVVTIMGADGSEEITADEIAALRGTINYEVTCNFSMRLERVYV